MPCGHVLVACMGEKGRHSQVGGDGVPFPLLHRQHEIGDPEHHARLVLIVLPMLLCQLQLEPRRDGKLLECRSGRGHLARAWGHLP